jgi:isopenicillin N synthase-like dioxygenase
LSSLAQSELNTVASRFEMVNKVQYRFVEGGTEEFDDEFRPALVDAGPTLAAAAGSPAHAAALADLATALGAALRRIGFAVVAGHGVPPEVFAACERQVPRVYARPLAEKLRHRAARPPGSSVNQGYFPKAETSELTPDLVEGWVFCRRVRATSAPAPSRCFPRRPLPAPRQLATAAPLSRIH